MKILFAVTLAVLGLLFAMYPDSGLPIGVLFLNCSSYNYLVELVV